MRHLRQLAVALGLVILGSIGIGKSDAVEPAENPCALIEGISPCQSGWLPDLQARKRSELIEQGLYAFPGQAKPKPQLPRQTCDLLEQNLRQMISLVEWRAGYQTALGMMANRITDATRKKIGAAMDGPEIQRLAKQKFGGQITASAQGVLLAAGCPEAKDGF